MSIAASVKHIAPVARALTGADQLVSFKSMYAPAVEVMMSLKNPVQASGVQFSERVAMESEEQVSEANEHIVGADAAAIEDQVSGLTRAINAMTFTARNVIIPTVDAMVNQFIARQSTALQPNVSVNVFKYHSVHDCPSLVNHVASKYAEIQAFRNYRCFILGPRSAEDIVNLVAENNPHLEQQQVVEWLLELGADRINAVWNRLFETAREFEASNVSFMQTPNWPLQIDELLLAYCLTGALIEQPQDVVGESVDLKEWERALGILHELLGNKLLRAYTNRSQDVKNQRLVLAASATDAIKTGIVDVLVNGDIYSAWLNAGGDVQSLLGLAVYQPHLRTTSQIAPVAVELAKNWALYYPRLRQSCLDNTLRQRRIDVQAVFLDPNVQTVEGLPTVDRAVFTQRLDAELRTLGDNAYDCAFTLFAKLVCAVYYREQPLYLGFLQSLNRYAKIHPEATGRELAIEAVIEMVACWLAEQITTVPFTPEVIPGAVLSTEEGSHVKIAEDNQAIAEALPEAEEEVSELPVEEPVTEGEDDAEPAADEADASTEAPEPADADAGEETPSEDETPAGEVEVEETPSEDETPADVDDDQTQQ